jgi:uncharacterized damage-inducible protein DinB
MMNSTDIRDIFDYNYWANDHLLATAEQLTPEQLTAPVSFSYGSLLGTLVHLLDTERGWRHLLQKQLFLPTLETADFPDIATLRARWREDERLMRAYLDSLGDEDLLGIISYVTDTGITRERVLWHCLFHVVNHGMQHRSEVAAMLTDYGHSPGDIDFTIFLNERNAKQHA